MENVAKLEFELNYIPIIIGYIIAMLGLVQIYVIGFIKRKEFFEDLRGKDKRWQLVEISALLWYILFPLVVTANIFGVPVESSVWLSLDGIYVANLTASKAGDYINLRWGGKNKEATNEIEDIKEDKKNEAI